MKLCIIGEDKDECIEMSNEMNDIGHSAIIIQYSGNFSQLASRINSVDVGIMLSNAPMKDAISANKNQNIRAAACNNMEELEQAADSDANLIVINPSVIKLKQLIDALSSSNWKKDNDEDEQEQKAKPMQQKQQNNTVAKPEQAQKAQKTQGDDANVENDDDAMQQDNKGATRHKGVGIKGKLYDIFGIE